MRRTALVALALATATPAAAQTPPPPPTPGIPAGVTIARVPVGGLTAEKAQTLVQAAVDKRLPFSFRKRRWSARPATFAVSADVARSVEIALAAPPGSAVKLRVLVSRARVARYVARLERAFNRPPRDSQLTLRSLRPHLSKPRVGFDVRARAMRLAITRALLFTRRATLPLQVSLLRPRVTRTNFGPIVVVRREARRLYLYRNARFVRRFPIAVGMPRYPTPLGRYHVVSKERNPRWDPPSSPWAAGLGPIPPGPANPLGTRWIGTSAPAIGIHGTPQPWTVGTAASHGCIRMYMRQVEWLFDRVRIGTPVFIVRA